MVAGLAPEKFSSYVGQQVRWARGMAQILRIENPLFNRKLKLSIAQRLCYFSATSHFFFGFPRLMYVIAPMIYMLLGISSVRGLGLETLFYALPHILLSMQTNHIPYKHVRFSFWNEIYEFAMSFQAGIVTLLALVNPKLGSFNVTDKGLTVTERNFDFESVRYLVYLSVIAAASLLTIPFWLIISPQDTQAVLINALWNVFNLFLLMAACLVAFEQPQLRGSHRIPRRLTATIHSGDQSWTGITTNVSESGALILLDDWPNVPDEVQVELVGDFGARVLLDAQIIRATATSQLQAQVAVRFIHLNSTQLDDLVLVIYSDVKEWYSQKREEKDNPIESFRFIALSIKRVFQEFRPAADVKVRKQVQAPAYLVWEKWGELSYAATITELGMRDLRLELETADFEDLEALQEEQTTLGLLVSCQSDGQDPQSLIAEVKQVEVLSDLGDRVVIELSFPPEHDRHQKEKIRLLLRSLN
jgi:cellulose synthase (UDP-forming)